LPSPQSRHRAEVWRDARNCVSAYGYVAGNKFWMHFPGVVTYCFGKTGRRAVAYRVSSVHEVVVRDVYRRSVVPMILHVRGREVLHASAVLAERGSIAFCGGAGAGKSTIAYALAQRGYRQLSDDSVVFTHANGTVHTVGLPFAVRLRGGPARYFGKPSKLAPPPLSAELDGKTGETAPLHALFVLDRSSAPASPAVVSIEALTPAEFFTAVLPHAYCFSLADVARKRRMVRYYLEVGSRVRAFRVRFRPGLENLPSLLDRVEESAARS
jgi:hypothetical protein